MTARITKGWFGESRKPKDATASRRLPIYRDFLLIQLAVLVFLSDQFSKYLVREFLLLYESFPREGFVRITHAFNTGSIFGLFQGNNTPLILVSFVGVAVLVLLYRSQRFPYGAAAPELGAATGRRFRQPGRPGAVGTRHRLGGHRPLAGVQRGRCLHCHRAGNPCLAVHHVRADAAGPIRPTRRLQLLSGMRRRNADAPRAGRSKRRLALLHLRSA